MYRPDEAAPARAASYSSCLVPIVTGAPQRGVVHSAFASAANLLFPNDVIISLNADVDEMMKCNKKGWICELLCVGADLSRPGVGRGNPIVVHARPPHSTQGVINRPLRIYPNQFVKTHQCDPTFFPGMPNGIQVESFPFAALRPGMPVLLGAERLVIDAINCSLDLSCCAQWEALIERPADLDVDMVQKNAAWLARELDPIPTQRSGRISPGVFSRGGNSQFPLTLASMQVMVRFLCGRGPGLTPSGDDMLLGWMAVNWLLYGSHPPVISACQEIVAVARQQTHLLSVCWLDYAARGYVALPIKKLLSAMLRDDERELAAAAHIVASMGATSGCDVLHGIVLGSSCPPI